MICQVRIKECVAGCFVFHCFRLMNAICVKSLLNFRLQGIINQDNNNAVTQVGGKE